MLIIRNNISENVLLEHHPLIFTQIFSIVKIFMIRKKVYFIAKLNFAEFLKASKYRDNYLLGCSVVTFWIA